MELNDFLSIGVVGAGLSLAIDWLKERFETKGWATKTVTLLFAILIGGLYVWLRQTSYLQTVLTVLGAASVIYAFFLKK